MAFLCTVDGKLVAGVRQHEASPAGWPRPWAFSCNTCGQIMPYGCVLLSAETRKTPDAAREVANDVHVCGDCEGFTQQQGLWG